MIPHPQGIFRQILVRWHMRRLLAEYDAAEKHSLDLHAAHDDAIARAYDRRRIERLRKLDEPE